MSAKKILLGRMFVLQSFFQLKVEMSKRSPRKKYFLFRVKKETNIHEVLKGVLCWIVVSYKCYSCKSYNWKGALVAPIAMSIHLYQTDMMIKTVYKKNL